MTKTDKNMIAQQWDTHTDKAVQLSSTGVGHPVVCMQGQQAALSRGIPEADLKLKSHRFVAIPAA